MRLESVALPPEPNRRLLLVNAPPRHQINADERRSGSSTLSSAFTEIRGTLLLPLVSSSVPLLAFGIVAARTYYLIAVATLVTFPSGWPAWGISRAREVRTWAI